MKQIIRKIKRKIDVFIWKHVHKTYITYNGFVCAICGKYVKDKIIIPSIDSAGAGWDTFEICQKCKRG